MLILNFSHPLTDHQKTDIEKMVGQRIKETFEIPVQFDNNVPYMDQILQLAETIPIDAHALQTEPLLVNLPSSNFIAAELLAWLHGQMGYFPAILRITPLAGSIPPEFQLAEIINLQVLRDRSRKQRT